MRIAIALLVVSTAFAGKPSTVHYVSGKDSLSAFLAFPDGKGPFPALIVVHEWWGLNDWVRGNAEKFAEKGFVALAIDLYRGKSTSSPDEAHQLMRGLPEDRARRDIIAAVAYLKSRPDVKSNRIGSIGWCMGGGFSLVTALNTPDLAACVICYGRLVTDSSEIAKIPCPILGIFGQEDKGITPDDVSAFADAVKHAGKMIDVQVYKGAGHAFMNPNNKDGYREKSAADAWSRIDQFLARLKS